MFVPRSFPRRLSVQFLTNRPVTPRILTPPNSRPPALGPELRGSTRSCLRHSRDIGRFGCSRYRRMQVFTAKPAASGLVGAAFDPLALSLDAYILSPKCLSHFSSKGHSRARSNATQWFFSSPATCQETFSLLVPPAIFNLSPLIC